VVRALLSHWRRHPLQCAALGLGLALATALWTGVQAINAQARQSYAGAAQTVGQAGLAQLRAPGGGRFDQQVFVNLRRAGWNVSPVIEGRFEPAGKTPVDVLGIDLISAPAQGVMPIADGAGMLRKFLTPPGLALAAPETIAALGDAPGLPSLQPSQNTPPGQVVIDIGIAQALLNAPGQLSRLIVLADQRTGLPPLDQIAPQLIQSQPRNTADMARLTDSFHLNLTAFGLLAFAVGLFIVHAAIGLAFEQRRVMFRTLRALGVSLNALTAALVAELLVIALVTGAVGVMLGYGIAALLLPDVAATLRGLYDASVPGSLSLKPIWWLGGLLVSVAGASVAAAQSLWRLRRLPILAPAQPRAWARVARRSLYLQIGAALGLALVAIALGVFGQGLVAGFALLGAMLLSAALALPLVLSLALRVGARNSRGVMAQWFWADTRHQLPGLSLALMALLLAISANVGVSTMVGSFRHTFTGYLDQRLMAEFYVTARTEDEARAIAPVLESAAKTVLPIRSAPITLQGAPGGLLGVIDDASYRDHWPLLSSVPGAWDVLARGEAALVNEQLARRHGLQPGDLVQMGADTALPIAAIYSDYGNPRGQAIVSLGVLETLATGIDGRRFALRIAPDQIPALRAQLQRDFGLPAENLSDQARMKAVALQVFERTFAVTGALNVLTLGVAGFAILTSLLTLAGMRLPQVAPVWAMGQTRARLSALEMARALALTALTMLFALPVGLLLAWVLLSVVNVAAFGWRLPMSVFPADWSQLGAITLLAGALSAAWPALRLARMAPAELVRVFTHER